ncbi:hypothetical protein [Streptomyces tsukubensis]|uniref:hypothetical protein n=1 Tax=Streptomyces tsukubensis TaxID=83656 RepID=UPI0034506200
MTPRRRTLGHGPAPRTDVPAPPDAAPPRVQAAQADLDDAPLWPSGSAVDAVDLRARGVLGRAVPG